MRMKKEKTKNMSVTTENAALWTNLFAKLMVLQKNPKEQGNFDRIL